MFLKNCIINLKVIKVVCRENIYPIDAHLPIDAHIPFHLHNHAIREFYIKDNVFEKLYYQFKSYKSCL